MERLSILMFGSTLIWICLMHLNTTHPKAENSHKYSLVWITSEVVWFIRASVVQHRMVTLCKKFLLAIADVVHRKMTTLCKMFLLAIADVVHHNDMGFCWKILLVIAGAVTFIGTNVILNMISNDLSTLLQDNPSRWMIKGILYSGWALVAIMFWVVRHGIERVYARDTMTFPTTAEPVVAHGNLTIGNDSLQNQPEAAVRGDRSLQGLTAYISGHLYQGQILSRRQGTDGPVRHRQVLDLPSEWHQAPIGWLGWIPLRVSLPLNLYWPRLRGNTLPPSGENFQEDVEMGFSVLALPGDHDRNRVEPLTRVCNTGGRFIEISSSIELYKTIHIGDESGEEDLESFRLQVENEMNEARIIDSDCTYQFGSMAILKYQGSDLTWWKLPKDWTPRIFYIRRSPWSVLDLLNGCRPKWTIVGSNLKTATLKAATKDDKEILKILHQYKNQKGQDVLVCQEPHLIPKFAPMFRKDVYISASNIVKVEEEVVLKLRSEAKNVTKPFWDSVVQGLLPSLWILFMIAFISLFKGLMYIPRGTLSTFCSKILFYSLGLQHAHDITILDINLVRNSILPHVFSEVHTFFIVYIFIYIIPGIISILWLHSRDATHLSGSMINSHGSTTPPIYLTGLQMVGKSSTSPASHLPPGITKLNDSVWKFYSPNGIPEVVVIFFHGLQSGDFHDAFWKTWLARNDNNLVWPQVWLSHRIPEARILSVSYNSSATQVRGQHDLHIVGENLVRDIIMDTDAWIGQNCPVILVGHSLGGLIIKLFILSAIRRMSESDNDERRNEHNRIKKFLENFVGVYYYATPHLGSNIADFVSTLPLPVKKSMYLKFLTTVDADKQRINAEFRLHRADFNAQAAAVAEGLPTSRYGFSAMVVDEGSARSDIEDFYTNETVDHITVCKATDMTDSVIGKLVNFIGGAVPDVTINSAHSQKESNIQ